MVEPSREPVARDEPDETSGGARAEGTPRWVKVAGLVALAVVLLAVVMLMAKEHHGPSRHLGRHAPLGGVTAPIGPAAEGIG